MTNRYDAAHIRCLEPVTAIDASNRACGNRSRTACCMARRQRCRGNVLVLVRPVRKRNRFQSPRCMSRAG